MQRLILMLLLACATMLSATTAWAVKPVDYVRGPFFFLLPWFDCTQFDGMDHWLWAEGYTIEEGRMYFGHDGVPIKSIGKAYTAEGWIWTPADPGCNSAPFDECLDPFTQMAGTNTLSAEDNAGRADHQTTMYRDWIWFEGDWYPTWGQASGVNLHVGVPGYGNIFSLAGHMVHQLNFDTGEWDVIQMTPNWSHPKIADVYAACSYVGNQ